jgi:hypothetical protein
VIETLDFQFERFFEFKTVSETLCGFSDSAFPLLQARIRLLHPRKILLPLAYIDKEMSQVPFIGLGNVGTSFNAGRNHLETFNVQRPTSNAENSTEHRVH